MKRIGIILLMLMLAGAQSILAQQAIVRYVDPRPLARAAQDGHDASYYDGTSWEKAMPNLQDAINSVLSSMKWSGYYAADGALKAGFEPGMVYVAGSECTRNTSVPTNSPYYNSFFNTDDTYHGGITYTPTESTEKDKDGVLFTSFKMYPGINVYGGYHGRVMDGNTLVLEGETGDQLKPENRVRDWQWNYKYKTILSGNHGGRPTTYTWNTTKNMYDCVFPGNSYHVVWFATNGFGKGANKRANALPSESVLNGFVIQDGRAGNRDLTETDYSKCHTAYGGGAYLVDNGVISNCVFLHNGAVRAGGSAYLDGGGLLDHCMVQRGQCEGTGIGSGLGGGVCIADLGMVRHSFVANCYANMGGGVAITHEDGYNTNVNRDALVVSSLITNNNAGTEAGGVYMYHGGIMNNVTVTLNRMTGPNTIVGEVAYGRSAGVFVDRNARILNSVMWGGFVRTLENVESHDDLQFAAHTVGSTDAMRPDVQFSALSYNEITDWNGCVRNSVISLSSENSGDDITGATLYPNFIHLPLQLKAGITSDFDNDANYEEYVGVCRSTMKMNHYLNGYTAEKGEDIDNNNFHYKGDNVLRVHASKHYGDGILFPNSSSALRAAGARVEDLTSDPAILIARIDVDAKNQELEPRSTIGAIVAVAVEAEPGMIQSVETAENYTDVNEGDLPTLFVDPNFHGVVADDLAGKSWDTPLTNVNDALEFMNEYLLEHKSDHPEWIGQILVKQGKIDISGSNSIGGRLRECFVLMHNNTRLYGGYPSTNKGTDIENRSPRKYETHLTGALVDYTSNEDINYDYNATHVVGFSGADNATLDGFHVMYGNATWINPEDGSIPFYRIANSRGAGLCYSDEQGSLPFVQEVWNAPDRLTRVRHNTVRNCVFANNTATNGSAVYINARKHKVKFDFINCAFRNNTATCAEVVDEFDGDNYITKQPKSYYDSEKQTYNNYNGCETGEDSPCTVFLSTQYAEGNQVESYLEATFDHCNFVKNVGYPIGISGLPGTVNYTTSYKTEKGISDAQLQALQLNDNMKVRITNSIIWANAIKPLPDSETLNTFYGDEGGKNVRSWYVRGLPRNAVTKQQGEYGAIFGIDNIKSPQAQAVMFDRWLNGFEKPDGAEAFTGYAFLTYKDESGEGKYTFPIFQNPTKNVGAAHGKQFTQYGGSCSYMPRNMNPIVNAAINSTQQYDYGRVPRSYGGAADIGYIENVDQPLDGTVYYVRDYTANGTNKTTYNQDSSPNAEGLGLYNEFGEVLDGKTWARAINGNATYPNAKVTNEKHPAPYKKIDQVIGSTTVLKGFRIKYNSRYIYLNGNTPALTSTQNSATVFTVSGVDNSNYTTTDIIAGTRSITANGRSLTITYSSRKYNIATANNTTTTMVIGGTTAGGYTIKSPSYNYYYYNNGSNATLSASTTSTRWTFEPVTETEEQTAVAEVRDGNADAILEGSIEAGGRVIGSERMHVYSTSTTVAELNELKGANQLVTFKLGALSLEDDNQAPYFATANGTTFNPSQSGGDEFVFISTGTNDVYYIYDYTKSQWVSYSATTADSNVMLTGTRNDATCKWYVIPSSASNRWRIVPGTATDKETGASWAYNGIYSSGTPVLHLKNEKHPADAGNDSDGNPNPTTPVDPKDDCIQWVMVATKSYDAYSYKNRIQDGTGLNGLQYAVNMANLDMSEHFVTKTETVTEKYNGGSKSVTHTFNEYDTTIYPDIKVWVGAGLYTYLDGWDIRDHVKVYGAFPKVGNPTDTERHPQLTTGVALSRANRDINVHDFETILQTHTTSPRTDTNARTNPTSVLTHPVECRVTTGDDSNRPQSRWQYFGAEWDGFTIRHGYKKGVTGSGSGRRNGGPGVSLYENVILRNCVVRDNYLTEGAGRSGGVYCDGSTIINCYIMDNESACSRENFGGGLYMIKGTIYNSVICGNMITASSSNHGCGAFFESANFYNNTVVDNTGADGALGVWTASAADAHLTLYNSIVMGGNLAVVFISGTTPVKFDHCFLQTTQANLYTGGSSITLVGDGNRNFKGNTAATANPFTLSEDAARANRDYRINQKTDAATSKYSCVNMGTPDLGKDYDGKTEVVLPEHDMDFTDRIQDCAVDIGAYEYNGAYLIAPTIETAADGKKVAYFYVTKNGRQLSSGNNPENAACWQKLQKILDAAGRYLYDHSDTKVVVKVAGDKLLQKKNSSDQPLYLDADGNETTTNTGNPVMERLGFSYLPTRNAGENELELSNPRFYSYMIPHGVEIWGGYSDSYTSTTNHGFLDANRRITENPTYILAQHFENGEYVDSYHCITFTNTLFDEEGQPIGGRSLENINKSSIVDGLFLTGGKATGETEDTQRGGAAIVPDYGVIRNCIVENNEASLEGGALYLEKGAFVLGTLVKKNKAGVEGGGIAVDDYTYDDGSTTNPNHTTDYQAMPRIIGCTVVLNDAKRGGGISFHTQLRSYATVLWQNDANEYDNLYGVFDPQKTISNDNTFDQYPISYCAVENVRVPGLDNFSVSSRNSEGVRFKTDVATLAKNGIEKINYTTELSENVDTYFGLEDYSVLVRTGVPTYIYDKYLPLFPYREDDFMDVPRAYYDEETHERVDFIDIGARAIGKFMRVRPNEGLIMTRLFVVPAADVEYETVKKLQRLESSTVNASGKYPDKLYSQQGSSYAYPMQQFDDALMYIREARKIKATRNGTDPQGNSYRAGEYAYRNTLFEIFIAGGTFYPMRNLSGEHSQSSSSTFLIPENVHVYGGLNIDDRIDNTNDNSRLYRYCQETSGSRSVGTGADVVELDPLTTDQIRLYHRRLYDLNSNSIIEPWEYENQTILNGETVNDLAATEKTNSYHVITVIAAEEYVGALPDAEKNTSRPSEHSATYDGKRIILDGLQVINGRAHTFTSESENPYGVYKGGGIYVNGSWMSEGDGSQAHPYTNVYKNNTDASVTDNHDSKTMAYRNIPLTLRSCKFMNNEAGEGAAIWTNSEMELYSCSFEANKAVRGNDYVESDSHAPISLSYDGLGGCIYSSNVMQTYNTLFANNEAERAAAAYIAGHGTGITVNCDVVRNLATEYPGLYFENPNFDKKVVPANLQPWRSRPHLTVNTVFWGNDAESHNEAVNYWGAAGRAEQMWFCAYEQGVGPDPIYDNAPADWKNYQKVPFTLGDKTIEDMFAEHTFDELDNNGNITGNQVAGQKDVNMNVIIASTNETDDGPNFGNPSLTAGVEGYMPSSDWMPSRQNNLTDNGWTYVEQDITYNQSLNDGQGGYDCTIRTYPSDDLATGRKAGQVIGDGAYYASAYDDNLKDKLLIVGEIPYMQLATDYRSMDPSTWLLRVSKDPNPSQQQTYIDIGVYEYQHQQLKPDTYGETDILWVSTKEKPENGVADGSSWLQPTSDVQRAIETLLASRNDHHKAIHFVQGDYAPIYTVSNNLGFLINTTNLNDAVTVPDNKEHGVLSLTFRGGFNPDVESQNAPSTWVRDFEDYPTVIRASERAGVMPSVLGHSFYIADATNIYSKKNTSGSGSTFTHERKDQLISLVFDGLHISNSRSAATEGGAAIYYADQMKDASNEVGSVQAVKNPLLNIDGTLQKDGSGNVIYEKENGVDKLYNPAKLTIKNCVFFANGVRTNEGVQGTAVSIGRGGVREDGSAVGGVVGAPLIYNSLFHSNAGKSIEAYDARIINCTFALNGDAIYIKNSKGANKNFGHIYTSMLWRNGSKEYELENMTASQLQDNLIYNIEDDNTYHNYWLSNTNLDVADGPNFRKPNETFRMGITTPASKTDVDVMQERDFHLMPGMKTLTVDHRITRAKLYYDEVSTDINNNLVSANGLGTKPAWDASWVDANSATLPDILFNDYDLSGPMNPDEKTNGYSRFRGKAIEYGAYEYKGDLQRVIYVNPSYSTDIGTGMSWNTAMERGRIQEALNLGAVYANNNPGYNAYVFCKAATNATLPIPTGESLIMRPGVMAFGSIAADYIDEVKGFTSEDVNAAYATAHSTELIDNYVEKMRQDRPGLVMPSTSRTIISGINGGNTLDKPSLLDGFDVCPETTVIDGHEVNVPISSPAVTLGPGNIGSKQLPICVRNTVVHDFTATEGNIVEVRNGLLYDVLVRNNTLAAGNQGGYNVTAERYGWILNTTIAGESATRLMAYGSNANALHLHNSLYGTRSQVTFSAPYDCTNMQPYAPYFMQNGYAHYTQDDRNNLSYQLVETSAAINGAGANGNGLTADAANSDVTAWLTAAGNGIEADQIAALRAFVDYKKDLDILGNPRVLDGHLDYGCYETWATKQGALTINNDRNAQGEYVAASYGGNMYPHEGSVVYASKPIIMESVPQNKIDRTEALTRIVPGYFLLQEGEDAQGRAAGWYGSGRVVEDGVEKGRFTGKGLTELRLAYAAIERKMHQKDNLVSLPFDYNYTNVPDAKAFWYDGQTRARWNYRFVAPSADGSESPCWQSATGVIPANKGVLLSFNSAQDVEEPVRFTALADPKECVYTEKDGKTVTLYQYDAGKADSDSDGNQDNIMNDGTPQFTSKENMGWNLVGQPFMVSRYYTEENSSAETYWTSAYRIDQPYQMHKPHEQIFFKNDNASDNLYAAVYNSWDAHAYSPAATAFFTQTAVTPFNSDSNDEVVENLFFGLPKLVTGTANARVRKTLKEFWGESNAESSAARTKMLVTDGILRFKLPAGVSHVNIYKPDGSLLSSGHKENVELNVVNGVYIIQLFE